MPTREEVIQYAREHQIPLHLIERNRSYGQLFPADNPLSIIMLRLMILRDDLDFELNGIIMRPQDDVERVWQHTYFMRRISSSVREAQNVLRQREFITFVRESNNPPLQRGVNELTERVTNLHNEFGELRNDLGGHVQPREAVAGLTGLHEWTAHMIFNTAHPCATTYRQFTMVATSFVWPETVNQEAFAEKHERLATQIPRTVGLLLHGIDVLLHVFWSDLPNACIDTP